MPIVRAVVRGWIRVTYGWCVHACPGQVFRVGTGAVGTFVVPSCRPFIAEGSVSKPIQSSRYQAASEVAAIAYNLNIKVHLCLPEQQIRTSCLEYLADVSARCGPARDWVAHRPAQIAEPEKPRHDGAPNGGHLVVSLKPHHSHGS